MATYDYVRTIRKYEAWKAQQRPTRQQTAKLKKLASIAKKRGVDLKSALKPCGKLNNADSCAKAINILVSKLYELNALPEEDKRRHEVALRFKMKHDEGTPFKTWIKEYNETPIHKSEWYKMHESGELVWLGDRTVKKSVLESEN